MAPSMWFWIIYAFGIVFTLWGEYSAGNPYPYPRAGRGLLIFILLAILGYRVFGNPIK
jgi:hypothetical protein